MVEDENSKLLTVAIPTYNRFDYLKALIENFILQFKFKPSLVDYVEILISDNHSTDDTRSFCENLPSEVREFIRYERHDENVGAGLNFISCVRKTKTSYVWLFGDDDQPCNDCLERIVKSLAEKPDILYISYTGYDTKVNSVIKFSNYNEYINFIAKLNPHHVLATTFITTCIFKKEIFNNDIALKKNNTLYGHSYALVSNHNASVKIDPNVFFSLNINKPPFAEDIENLLPAAHHRFLLEVSFRYKSSRILFFAYQKHLNYKRKELKSSIKRFFKLLFRL